MCFLISFCCAQESKYIPIKDGIIHYRTFGKGKPIVIINGGPGMNCEGFATLAEQISKQGFLCIIYDQRGTGKSKINEINQTTINMQNMVDDLEILRNHLNIKNWTVLGQSFGGLLAAQYAYTFPKSINKIIFSNSGGLNLDFLNYVGNRIQNNLSQEERDSMTFYESILAQAPENKDAQYGRARQLASAYVYNKQYKAIMAERMLQVNLNINQLVYRDLQSNKYDFVDKFAQNKIPVLIFQGLNDIISLETAQVIQKTFSGSKLVKLEHCAHYPWLDRADIFWTEFKDFMGND